MKENHTTQDSPEISGTVVRGFLKEKLWHQKKWILGSLFFALITVTVQIMQNTLAKSFFDDGVLPHDTSNLVKICLALVIYFLIEGLVTYCHRFFLRIGTEGIVKETRYEVFERLLVFSQSKMAHLNSGKAVNHIISDVSVISSGLHIIADLIQSPLTIIGMLGYLFYLNWQLTLVCFVAIPLVALVGKALGASAGRNQARIQKALEQISMHIIESVRGLKTAHAFNQTSKLQNEFEDRLNDSYKHYVKLARVEEVVAPLTKWVTSWIGAAIIGFGGYLVIQDAPLAEAGDPKAFTAGALIAFLMAAGRIQQPLRQLNQVNVRYQQVFVAAQRICRILHEKLDALSEDQQSILNLKVVEHKPLETAPEIVFQNVGFTYPARDQDGEQINKPALSNINFTIKPGEKIALVGRSGSGKSTLSLLALRFLDPGTGNIFMGDKKSIDWPLEKYRQQFSYVSQDVYLFDRSVRENLFFAAPAGTDEEMFEALEKAHVLDFIHSLPAGLDTQLGESASTLSGGEKQRIAIARAFLRNAPILVLDEATSQLDAHSEEGVQLALKDLMAGRSAIVIAHRLSTIREMDKVLVMDSGQIIEEGTPDRLIQDESSHFFSLWNKQMRDKKNRG